MVYEQTPGLARLNLKRCTIHNKLFSAREGSICSKCAPMPTRRCKNDRHDVPLAERRCQHCAAAWKAARRAAK
jgi:hypothetical protein